MLQAPMDYTMNVIDPFAAGLAGFQMGQQGRMAEQNQQINMQDAAQRQAMNAQGMEANAQNMSQNATTFAQGQEDRATQQQRAKEFAADQLALAQKVSDKTATTDDFNEFTVKYPEVADEMKSSFDGIDGERRKNDAFELSKAVAALKAGKPEVAIKMLEERATAAENSGKDDDAGMARAMIEQIRLDPTAGLTVAGLALHQLDPESAKLMFPAGEDTPADVRSLQWRADQAGLKPGTPEYQKFIAENGGKNGDDAPASFRALELQADAAGLQKGSAEYQQFMATKGAGLVSEATAAGKTSAENSAALASMNAKMPGLELVVESLGDLAGQATYTSAGQLLDTARAEAGLSPRPEAIARAEYIAMVDNQVLPLLRDTFGAAFTQKEGDTLRATLGDPDKTPEAKKAVLKAFITQKKRDIEALKKQVDEAPVTQPQGDDDFLKSLGLEP